MNPAAPAEPRPVSGRGIKPAASLKAHFRLAVATGTVVVVLGVPVAWVKGKSEWSTSATLRVSPRFARNLESDAELELQSNSQYREFVQQQIRTVNRLDIVEGALKELGKKVSLWRLPGESDLRMARRLQGSLSVAPVPDTYMFTVSLSGPKPDGLPEVVNAVVKVYLESVSGEELWGATARVDELVKQRENLLKEIRFKTERRTALGRELGMTAFSAGVDMNAWDKLLLDGRTAFDAAARRQIEAESKLLAVDGEARAARPRPTPREPATPETETAPEAEVVPPDADEALEAMAWSMISLDPTLSALTGNLTKRRSDLLISTSGMTPDHPARVSAERELAEIDAEIAKRTVTVRAKARAILLAQRRAEAYEAARTTQELGGMVETRRAEALRVGEVYNEALSLTSDLDRARKRLDAIDNRIDFLQLESRAPGWVRVLTKALPPEFPSKGGKKKLLLFVLVAAAGAALVVPIAVDILDPRIRSANEAEKMLEFAPLGWVIDRTGADTEAFAADQLRRIAQKLEHDCRTNGTRIVVLTSSKPREGTTTLVLDLARTLGELGLRSVAVEANALRPSPLYGEPGPAGGFASILASGGDLRAAVLPATSELPDRIPVGATTRSLAPIARLDEVLASLAASYDLALLDAPPILLSADAEALVRAAGLTVLVIEAESLPKAVIKRALRALEKLEPRAVGAVVNRVRPIAGGGYFSEALTEQREARRAEHSSWLSPWLWR